MSRTRWLNALTGIAASMQQTTIQAQSNGSVRITDQNGQSNGTYQSQSTVTIPDYSARASAAERIASDYRSAATRADNILSSALKANTVFPNQKLTGLVYFKNHDKGNLSAVIMKIGDTNYIFDFKIPKFFLDSGK